MEKINSEVLLRNARNYIKYYVITRNGKESEKDYAYTESLCRFCDSRNYHNIVTRLDFNLNK